METKTCTKCNLEKPLTKFHIKDKVELRYISQCKDCYRGYYIANREKAKEYQKKYAEDHKEYFAEYREKRRRENPNYDPNTPSRKKLTPEEKIIRKKELTRKKTIKKQIKFETDFEYRKKVTAYKTKYVSDRKKRDPIYSLTCSLRYKMRSYLKQYATDGKKYSCEKYGIRIKDIIAQVGPRPSKDHDLDHIIPVTAFDWNYPDDIIMANNPHNFRWITKQENKDKSDFIFFKLIESDQILLEIATKIGITVEHEGLSVRDIKLIRQTNST